MNEAHIEDVLERLRADQLLVSRLLSGSSQTALQVLPDIRIGTDVNDCEGLRRLPSPDDLDTFVGQQATQGPMCTQAGCYTHEARCASQYACSGSPPRC
jgi:hypothetical protein